jgi:hypothetical protein
MGLEGRDEDLTDLSRPNATARVKVARLFFRFAKLSSQIAACKAIISKPEQKF